MEKVLLVDDEELIRERLKKTVEKEGWEVLLAADGEQAIHIFEKEKPGIVITDLRMPKIDGIELLNRVKKMEPLTQVIVITGHGDYDLAIDALRGGALDYLKKPFNLDRLFIALGRAKENLLKLRIDFCLPTVLVIEDDDTAREQLARFLSKEGYRVITAADGDQGMIRFEETKVDIILADLKMPKKDGLEVLHEVNQITEDVETIVITGYGDERTAIQAMREGAANYLRKPLDLDGVLLAVANAFERLNLKRSVLFRKREVELEREIVAKITSKKELLIDVRDGVRKDAIDFAESLVEAVPLNLLVVDRERNVLFANRAVRDCAGEAADSICEEFLAKMGLGKLSVEEFKELVNKVFDSPSPLIECKEVSRYAFVIITKLFILTDEGTQKVVLAVLRGERRKVT